MDDPEADPDEILLHCTSCQFEYPISEYGLNPGIRESMPWF